MKRFFIVATLALVTLCCHAIEKQALTLHLDDGTRIVYFLDNEPVIGFEGQAMVVTVDDESSTIPMGEILYWEVGMAEYSGDEAVGISDNVNIRVYGNTVTVSNPSARTITIFDLSGRAYAASSEPVASFTLSRGIYLINVADKSYKVAIR